MSKRLPLLLALLAAASASAQISTDRPGLGFSPLVVPQGTFQVEAGTPQATRFNAPEASGVSGSLTVYSFPVALRYGLTETIELRAGTPSVYDIVSVSIDTPAGNDSDSDRNAGLDVVEVGAKIQLATNGPTVALIPSVLIPTIEGGDLAAVARVVAGFALTERVGLTAVLGGSVTDAEPDARVVAEAVAVIGTALSDAFSVYGEVGAFPQDGGTPVLAGGGLLFLVSPDVQLDASFNVGLTDEAADLLFGAGLSFRF